MNREEAEKRAFELYPKGGISATENARLRKSYLQCFDDLSKSKDITKTCGYCVEPKSDNSETNPVMQSILREASKDITAPRVNGKRGGLEFKNEKQ